MTSPLTFDDNPGIHVAIIMDGNGRWAVQRGHERTYGHRAGERSVRTIVEAAPDLGITTLTLYAFSVDNWHRPIAEVAELMRLLEEHLYSERERCVNNGVRLNLVGRRDRLSPSLLEAIRATERATEHCRRLHLRIAVDYSSRDAIVATAARLGQQGITPTREALSKAMNAAIHSRPAAPDVDLLIRTSGEQRLSDFLLWECAYAELSFVDRLWPDFDADDLATAVQAFWRRDRRFGALKEPQAATA